MWIADTLRLTSWGIAAQHADGPKGVVLIRRELQSPHNKELLNASMTIDELSMGFQHPHGRRQRPIGPALLSKTSAKIALKTSSYVNQRKRK